LDDFVNHGLELEGDADLAVTWKSLWDATNLYVLVEVTDDEIVNEDSCNWEDDSVEVYIDAQNLDVEDYRPGSAPGIPAYQLTAIAGNNPTTVCGELRIHPDSTSAFSWGINSYGDQADPLSGMDDETTQYPEGADTSKSVVIDANHYSFEASFPWTALEETPANIQARGSFGFGIGINDDDDGGGRDSQPIWATDRDDLWMRSDTMPSVSLVGGAAGVPGDFDGNGSLTNVDIDQLAAEVRAGTNTARFDLTSDALVNKADQDHWVNVLKKTYYGDANLDGLFNSGDLVSVFTVGEYEDTTAGNSGWADGDWNGDAEFNSGDFVEAFSAGGYEAGPRPSIAAVPEPSTLAIFGIGAALLAIRRIRRR
jgi:hypothetical protein